MGATDVQVPKWLEKAMKAMTEEAKITLKELLKEYKFAEEDLDAFEMNSGPLSPDNLPKFAAEVKGNATKSSEAKGNSSTPRPKPKAPMTAKRPRIPGGLFGIGGSPPRKQKVIREALPDGTAMDVTTEQASADFQIVACETAKYESPVKHAQHSIDISLKSSVNDHLVKPIQVSSDGRLSKAIQVRGDPALSSGARRGAYEWMDESIEEKHSQQESRLVAVEEQVTKAVIAESGRHDLQVAAVGVASQAEVALCGRIVCEGVEGKLNERSILLEGSRATGGGQVHLNVSDCSRLAAFPGQIVGVLGRSGGMTGGTFHTKEFLGGLPIPTRPEPRGEQPLSMFVAAGPYCLRNGLDYTPLEKILEHAFQEKPDILVLMGPFLDASNQQVVSGETVLPGSSKPCSFEDVYARCIVPILERGIGLIRQSFTTEVIIIPALDEALCFHPLPQPALDSSLCLEPRTIEKLKRLGAKLLPNPAHIKVRGLDVSFSSADALSPVLREIIVRPEGGKIQESFRQLLLQRTLFPVLPREPAQVSECRAGAFDFPGGVPDICIFPTQMGNNLSHAFVDGTVFVNPGSVCKAKALGTFAELTLVPPDGSHGVLPFVDRVRIDLKKLS